MPFHGSCRWFLLTETFRWLVQRAKPGSSHSKCDFSRSTGSRSIIILLARRKEFTSWIFFVFFLFSLSTLHTFLRTFTGTKCIREKYVVVDPTRVLSSRGWRLPRFLGCPPIPSIPRHTLLRETAPCVPPIENNTKIHRENVSSLLTVVSNQVNAVGSTEMFAIGLDDTVVSINVKINLSCLFYGRISLLSYLARLCISQDASLEP